MRVLKFGGTSVGDAAAFERVARIIMKSKQDDPDTIVVTSAMAGITDQIIAAAHTAADGDDTHFLEVRETMLAKHRNVVDQLITDDQERAAVMRSLEASLDTFERLCRSINILGELTPRGLDVVAGIGERLAAPLLACVLRTMGLQAESVEAGDMIITDAHFGAAVPIMNLTQEGVNARLQPLLIRGVTPICTGYIGATVDGVPTTLGRGGSDYSASIVGACVRAAEIQIWSDVDGILTADPRTVPQARSLAELTYSEAAEMAFFGAEVLHPSTVLPAIDMGIPLRILNSHNPDYAGTRIVSESPHSNGTVKAVSAISNLCMVSVVGRGMIGVPGIAARTFDTVARQHVNVLMISQSSSEQSICFIIPQEERHLVVPALEEEFEQELSHRLIDGVEALDDVVIIAVVGAGMRGAPGVAGHVYNALGEIDINVISITQGPAAANISLVVAQGDVGEALRHIHDTFELHRLPDHELL